MKFLELLKRTGSDLSITLSKSGRWCASISQWRWENDEPIRMGGAYAWGDTPQEAVAGLEADLNTGVAHALLDNVAAAAVVIKAAGEVC